MRSKLPCCSDELRTVAEENPAVVKELQQKLEAYIASDREITGGSFSDRLA
jgi:hypothetical protein